MIKKFFKYLLILNLMIFIVVFVRVFIPNVFFNKNEGKKVTYEQIKRDLIK